MNPIVSTTTTPNNAVPSTSCSQTDDDDNDKNNNSSNKSNDIWASTAELYANQVTRLTERHGCDLIALIVKDIASATTILDIGCGTGAFAKAYLEYFPKGIPGQTIILSDLSPAMLEKAQEGLTTTPNHLPTDFQTKITFQQEDGTTLTGIADNSIDIVVSLFGVFLIPDQEATMKSIQRVLRKKPTTTTTSINRSSSNTTGGVFANASWVFDISTGLTEIGIGASLQDVLALSTRIIDPLKRMPGVEFWSNRNATLETLGPKKKQEEEDNVVVTNQWQSIQVACGCHTSVWEFPILWDMLAKNPMAIVQGATPEDVQRAKDATSALATNGGKLSLDEPLILSSVSNLTVCRGVLAR